MRKLRLAAFAASLAVLPAAAHAQLDDQHAPGADQAQHDHSTSPAGGERDDPAAMRPRQMRDGMHMANCCCPCCEMMQQHGGGMVNPSKGEGPVPSPEQPENHQH